MDSLVPLLLLGLALAFWLDSLRARERALSIITRTCRDLDVQLLDQTVALSKVRVGFKRGRPLELWRTFVFEFSTDGANRRRGQLVLANRRIESFQVEQPDGIMFL